MIWFILPFTYICIPEEWSVQINKPINENVDKQLIDLWLMHEHKLM